LNSQIEPDNEEMQTERKLTQDLDLI